MKKKFLAITLGLTLALTLANKFPMDWNDNSIPPLSYPILKSVKIKGIIAPIINAVTPFIKKA